MWSMAVARDRRVGGGSGEGRFRSGGSVKEFETKVPMVARRLVGSALMAVCPACSPSPADVRFELSDGEYVVTTGAPRIVDEFATPAWMRQAPVIRFVKEGTDFSVIESSDDQVVEGSPQLAEFEGTFWRLHFGWAEDEEDHYWEVLLSADECLAAAVDADLGIPPTGSLTVVLGECVVEGP